MWEASTTKPEAGPWIALEVDQVSAEGLLGSGIHDKEVVGMRGLEAGGGIVEKWRRRRVITGVRVRIAVWSSGRMSSLRREERRD